MNEFEEEIVHDMMLRFYGIYGHDPTTWYKHELRSGGFYIEARGKSNESVANGLSEGFDWMGFDTEYTPTEMALLATGFISLDEPDKLQFIGRLFDKAMEEFQ